MMHFKDKLKNSQIKKLTQEEAIHKLQQEKKEKRK